MTLPNSTKLQSRSFSRQVTGLALSGNDQSLFLLAVLLVVAVSAIYGQFLQNPIVFDDDQFFMVGGHVLDHYDHFAPFEVRWLPYATLNWTANLLGLDLIWFRLGSLMLHAATGVALFLFLQRLFALILKDEAGSPQALAYTWMAFFAALFFVLHPVAVYGAAYLIERTIVMATLFSLLTLYVYMRGLTEGRPRWLWVSVGLYYLAIFSKEHAVMLPAVMLALTLLLERPSIRLAKRLAGIYAACALIAGYVALQKLGLLGSVYEIDAPSMLAKIEVEHAYPLSVLTQSFLFFKYWFLWLLPNPAWMSVDMREPFADSILSPYLLAAAAFLGYGIFGFWLLSRRGRLGLLGFALLFPWLLFMTEFTTVRIQESFVLYRSYLWMAGAFAALPLLVMRVQGRLAFVGLLLGTLLLSALAVNRLTTFSHPFLLWDDAATLIKNRRDLPGVDRIYYNRATSLLGIKRYPEAIADYRTALALRPDFLPFHQGIAVAYLDAGNYPAALLEFSNVIGMDSKFVRAYFGRGLTYAALGRRAAALADFNKSCELGWKSGCAKAQALGGKG